MRGALDIGIGAGRLIASRGAVRSRVGRAARLGHQLISSQPDAGGGELDEGEVV